VEQIGEVQTVTPGEVEGKPSGLFDLIGRLHPALVHFPIAWLVGLALVDFVGLILKREAWQRAGIFVLGGTLLSLLPTAATGLLRAAHMPSDVAVHSLLVTHRTLNFAMAGLVLTAFVLRLLRRDRLQDGGALSICRWYSRPPAWSCWRLTSAAAWCTALTICPGNHEPRRGWRSCGS